MKMIVLGEVMFLLSISKNMNAYMGKCFMYIKF
jgi:hypothetical protein